jgi:hypothetical protein
MELVLLIVALIGLVVFVVFGLLWLLAPSIPRRSNNGTIAVVGLIIWALASIVMTFNAIF